MSIKSRGISQPPGLPAVVKYTWLTLGIHVAYTRHTRGMHMAYTWHTHGVHMEWNTHGIHMGYTWNTHGTLLAYLWNTHVGLTEYTWNTCGVRISCVRHTCVRGSGGQHCVASMDSGSRKLQYSIV